MSTLIMAGGREAFLDFDSGEMALRPGEWRIVQTQRTPIAFRPVKFIVLGGRGIGLKDLMLHETPAFYTEDWIGADAFGMENPLPIPLRGAILPPQSWARITVYNSNVWAVRFLAIITGEKHEAAPVKASQGVLIR